MKSRRPARLWGRSLARPLRLWGRSLARPPVFSFPPIFGPARLVVVFAVSIFAARPPLREPRLSLWRTRRGPCFGGSTKSPVIWTGATLFLRKPYGISWNSRLIKNFLRWRRCRCIWRISKWWESIRKKAPIMLNRFSRTAAPNLWLFFGI